MDRLAAAAQKGGVAGLGAEDGGIAGDVRTGFVDDADDPDRHALLADFDAVGPGPGAQDFADRIGQIGHGADAVRHVGEALVVQTQAVQHRPGEAVRLTGGHVPGVRREDSGLVTVQRVGHRAQTGVLLVGGQPREVPGGGAGTLAEVQDFGGKVHGELSRGNSD